MRVGLTPGPQHTPGDGTDALIGIEWLEGSRFGDTLAGSIGADRPTGATGATA